MHFDPIIQTKICPISGQPFTITQGDIDFYNKISPTFAGQKFQIPTPTLCPEERQRRRLAFRNERNLYRRTCDASGKQLVSVYSPDKPYKVYDKKTRRSDSRNALDYGQDFDFSKTFTDQFHQLRLSVPLYHIQHNKPSENSDYCNIVADVKDCYLLYNGAYSKNIYYSNWIGSCNDCIDISYSLDSTGCYECLYLVNCYNCLWSRDCTNSHHLISCAFCNNCSYCINCDNLEGKTYYINNNESTKEEYEQYKKVTNYNKVNHSTTNPQRIIGSENCTGKYILGSSDVFESRDVSNVQCAKYIYDGRDSKDLMDYYEFFENCSLCLEGEENGSMYKSLFTKSCFGCHNLFYCVMCYANTNNCFGCIGLRNESYCIFNKQYTKESYEQEVKKIIGHMIETGEWGEFFHPSLSPFGYNETVAQEYYPIGRDMLVACPTEGRITNASLQQWGYKRSDYESPKPVSDKIIQGKDLGQFEDYLLPSPANEANAESRGGVGGGESILHYAISCKITEKLFRIQPQELAFYRKHHIPLPRKHPDQRHLERLALRQ